MDGEVGLKEVQEARGQRREVEAPELPLAPQQAGARQQRQQQQQRPEERHGWRPTQRPCVATYISSPAIHPAARAVSGPP